MGKILLYYKYVSIRYPKRVLKWLQKICSDLELKGRILLGIEGINGTVGGSEININRFKKIMGQHELFGDIDFKESQGNADCFPKMVIKIRNEIVTLGIPADKLTPKNGGKHLKPEETHKLIEDNPEDLLILDARNKYEWKIGKFKNAITPDIENFRELPQFIDKNLEQFKDKKVLMYCTGGIRCERASAYLKEKHIAKEVYQMDGGIQKYAEKYPDGFFRGKNYVFDGRVSVKINNDILSTCELCNIKCDDYINCLNALCNKHFVCCADCVKKYENTCSKKCQMLVQEKKVHTRPQFNKVNSCSIK